MSWRDLWRRLFPSRTVEPDVEEELRFHLEGKVEELMAGGMSEEEARAEARRRFGDWDQVQAATRRYATQHAHRQERRATLAGVRSDLVVAARGLVRRPGFSAAVVLTLALGIGAVSGVFSVVDGVLLEPLPLSESDRLIRIVQQNSPTNRWGASTVDFRAIEGRNRTLGSVAAVVTGEAALQGEGRPRWVRVARVTPGYFRSLGVPLAVGRGFRPEEGEPGAAPAAVVTHALAEERFTGAEAAVGETLVLGGRAHTVVGVLPPGVTSIAGRDAEVWPVLQLEEPTRRGPFFLTIYARLATGASLAEARDDLARISEEIFPTWSDTFQDGTARLTPISLRESLVGDVRPVLLVFLGGAALVLLIALANVSNLMLARATARDRELAVRASLGAGRLRLARSLLAEALVLGALGGLAGLVLATAGVDTFARLASDYPRIDEVAVDARAVAVTLAVTALAAAACGLLPLLGSVSRDPAAALRGQARGGSEGVGVGKLRSGLVVSQFGLALPLLTGAALLLGSLERLQAVDPGFDPSGLTSVRLSLPESDYPGYDQIQGAWEAILREVRARPEVEDAALAGDLPPSTDGFNNFEVLGSSPSPAGAQPTTPWIAVTPGYFDVVGIPLLDGRTFAAHDTAGSSPVAVVTRSWTERYASGGGALSTEMIEGGCTTCPPTRVVGVVGDVAFQGLDGARDAVFVPLRSQGPAFSRTMHVLARLRGDAGAALASIRDAIRSVDPSLPLTEVTTPEERLYASLARPRHLTLLMGAFAVAAAALAAVGIFGVLSYVVSRREREIGVRIALGAEPRSVVGMVVRRGMGSAGLGVALGLAASLVGSRLLEGFLFGVSPTDPATLATTTALLAAVALAACWLPARRAARVDPMDSITAE